MSPITRPRREPQVAFAARVLIPLAIGGAPSPGHPPVPATVNATLVEVGRPRIVAIPLSEPSESGRALDPMLANPSLLELLPLPGVGPRAWAPAGERIAYLRVRGLCAGGTELELDEGRSTLRITVTAPRVSPPVPQAVVTSPSPGAAVWGKTAVEVRVAVDGLPTDARIVVRVQAAGAPPADLEPTEDDHGRDGHTRRLGFTLDGEALAAGPAVLTPSIIGPAGESPGRPISVRVLRPTGADLLTREAEDHGDAVRPERFGKEPPPVRWSLGAAGGRYVSNNAGYPPACLPFKIERTGLYQVMATVAGDPAAGAHPTLALYVDGSEAPVTNGRCLSESWHRIALGVPIRLEAGDRLLTPLFDNDFYVPDRADRNLRIDRVELAALDDVPVSIPELGAAGDAMAMVMGAPGLEAPTEAAPPAPAGAMEPSGGAMSAMGAPGAMDAMGAAPQGSPADLTDPDPFALRPGLRIALARPMDTHAIAGSFELEGFAAWDGRDRRPAPVVTLLVNDRPVASQRAGAPRFYLDSALLLPGDNSIRLVARADGGATASTPVQTVRFDPPGAPPGPDVVARRFLRFTMHEGWDESVPRRLSGEGYPPEGRSLPFPTNGSATLTLPDELAGTFDVFVEGRGQDYEGPALARVTLLAGAEPIAVGEATMATWWTSRPAGRVTLAPGRKQLEVAFVNDAYKPKVGDRNMWLQGVVLMEPDAREADRLAPAVSILYPPAGHDAFMADCLIARATDDRAIAAAEVLLDGQPTGIRRPVPGSSALVVLPLLLREVPPGPHTLAVRARDGAGNTAESAPVTITVAPAPPPEPGADERARPLLDRFALGPDDGQLAAILTLGERAYLRTLLDRPLDDAGDLAALGLAAARFPNPRGEYDVPRRAILHALVTPNPVRARLALWIENHFSTWIRKLEGTRKWEEHIALSRLGPAPFADLLMASASSPAMLRYLDQEQSFVGRLNENYAREVMELHTLGVHGGYTQADVTALARLLTGWTAVREGDGAGPGEAADWRFAFDPALSDGAAIEWLGILFPETPGEQRYQRARLALEVLAAHPATARFVCRKLAEHYIACPAPGPVVEDLAGVFEATGGDLREVLLAIADHPAFWASARTRLAKPLDFALRLDRAAGRIDPWQLGDFLQRCASGVFDRSTPDGYPELDAEYADSNAMLQRWRYARDAVWALASLVPDRWRYTSEDLDPRRAQAVTDLIAVRLTGRVLGETSNRSALEFLSALPGSPDERIRDLAAFIAQLPEAHLR